MVLGAPRAVPWGRHAHSARARQNVLAGKGGGGGNSYEMAQNLMTLARLSGPERGRGERDMDIYREGRGGGGRE